MNTTEPMPQEQLDAIQRRVESATEGPWSHWSGFDQRDNCIKSDTDEGMYTVAEAISEAGDARFVARARTDIPALLTDNERLRALTTVDDAMVERAARAYFEDPIPSVDASLRPKWDHLVAACPGVADSYRRHMRAALDVALGTGEVK